MTDDADKVTYSCTRQDSDEGSFVNNTEELLLKKETPPSNSNKISLRGTAAIVLVVVSVAGVVGVTLVMRMNEINTLMTSDIDADGSGTMANLDNSDAVTANCQTLILTEDQIISRSAMFEHSCWELRNTEHEIRRVQVSFTGCCSIVLISLLGSLENQKGEYCTVYCACQLSLSTRLNHGCHLELLNAHFNVERSFAAVPSLRNRRYLL